MKKRTSYFDKVLEQRRINPKYPNIWYNKKSIKDIIVESFPSYFD